MTTIFDGKTFSQIILNDVKLQVKSAAQTPVLAIILVGDNEGSKAYIRQKLKAAAQVGLQTVVYHFQETISQQSLLKALTDIQAGRGPSSVQDSGEAKGEWVHFLNNPIKLFPRPHAVIVQRPLPNHIDYDEVLAVIDPTRDIDGFHPKSPFFAPVAIAVWEILCSILSTPSFRHSGMARIPSTEDSVLSQKDVEEQLKSMKIVLVGYGETAGKPIAKLFSSKGIELTIITHETINPAETAQQADILISAVGKPSLVKPDWVKPEAILIDVGISRIMQQESTAKLQGDIAPEAYEIASYITPVPGGVGPVNVACLMRNVLLAAYKNS